jgi:hypothetical protein
MEIFELCDLVRETGFEDSIRVIRVIRGPLHFVYSVYFVLSLSGCGHSASRLLSLFVAPNPIWCI